MGFPLTSRLNQNCIENFVSVITGKEDHRVNPISMEIRDTFREVGFDHIMEQSARSNCIVDTDDILLTTTDV